MTVRPIIFSAPMVLALLEGRKSQTRRVLGPGNTLFNGRPWTALHKAQTWAWKRAFVDDGPSPAGNPGPYLHVPWADGPDRETFEGTVHRVYPRMQPRDVLWVREAAAQWGNTTVYKANATPTWIKWRPSIHMPREWSRLTLVVTDVRVQRLQDISEDDALAEGVTPDPNAVRKWGYPQKAKFAFADLWDHLHGPGAWELNPWVMAYAFTVHRCNVDALARAA